MELIDWARAVLAARGEEPARHHLALLRLLERVGAGDIDRLIVSMPPGSAKSTYVSVLFPAWWFHRHPRSSLIAASHTESLAAHFGRQARDLLLAFSDLLGCRLAADSRSATHWRTAAGGEYFATGLRGPITGRRADLAIIDDPVKSFLEADRAAHRDRTWEWFRSELVSRLKPRGRIILVMTRWHEDDLAGRLLRAEGREWHQLRLPALAEANDPLGRAEGEPLWPEWEDRAALERKRRIVGERIWSALYQQAPRPPLGGLFKPARIAILDPDAPLHGKAVRAWDLAATAADGSNDPDWTVGIKLLLERTGRFVIADVVRFRAGPHEVRNAISTVAKADGRSVSISLPEDPGQAGRTQAASLIRMLAGFVVCATRETGSKLVRALPLASQIEGGNFAMLRADWNGALTDEMRDFPNGRKDDQIDALARAFSTLTEAPAPSRSLQVPMMAR